ncbi:MAG: hypothetical protein KatS3mg060_0744 [Dehalococcoidia bacterium]|nr:MAG: hypothetical protein KatS3mg060_0744 [Dehalococcoidia bacterium]
MFAAVTRINVRPGSLDETLALEKALGTSPHAVERLTLVDPETNTLTVIAIVDDEAAARTWGETDHGRAVIAQLPRITDQPVQRSVHRVHRHVRRG